MTRRRKCLLFGLLPLLTLLLLLLGVLGIELWTAARSAGHCHDTAADCRGGDVAVVLGCSKYLRGGQSNPYFKGRMDAAAELWKRGKLSCIIVSGDNREKHYNEPRVMDTELCARGVPHERIIRDYAGLRTYDSVVRADKVFGAKKITFISQPDHVQRAVAMARSLGMDAEGYEAPLPPTGRALRLRQFFRERAARAAMVFDLLTGRRPHFLGDPITLPE